LSLTRMQLERLDRFEEFMIKWELELECMKQMITELYEAEFPKNNVDSIKSSRGRGTRRRGCAKREHKEDGLGGR
jgi:hypothetical protein